MQIPPAIIKQFIASLRIISKGILVVSSKLISMQVHANPAVSNTSENPKTNSPYHNFDLHNRRINVTKSCAHVIIASE